MDSEGTSSMSSERKEELLKLIVRLDNGEEGFVFSFSKEENPKGRWKCHVCKTSLFNTTSLEAHVRGKNHIKKMSHTFHPNEYFTRLKGKRIEEASAGGVMVAAAGVDLPTLAPGEPVPPGMEDVVKWVAEIQTVLDSLKAKLIGLEFLCELTASYSDEEPRYYCLLCSKKGDCRTVLIHLISFTHRIRYLERYFPKAYQALNNLPKAKEYRKGTMEVLAKIVQAIESKFGRFTPYITEASGFDDRVEQIRRKVEAGKHFHETADSTYDSLVDLEQIKKYSDDTTDDLIVDQDRKEAQLKSSSKYKPGQPTVEEKQQIKTMMSKKIVPSTEKSYGRSSEYKQSKDKVRSKSRDRSISIISSDSSRSLSISRSRSRSLSRSRSRSRSNKRIRLRSRSRSPYRNTSFRNSRKDDFKYSSRRVPPPRSRYQRSRSRSRNRSPYRRNQYSAPNKDRHSFAYKPASSRYDSHDDSYASERPKSTQTKVIELRHKRNQHSKYNDLVSNLERDMLKKLRYFEKNPEKHPLYPEEWKKFWNRRYKELISQGVDASKHDFKPEWIGFWTGRMKEIHDEDLSKKKEDYREQLGITDQSLDVIEVSPTPLDDDVKPVTVDDIKNTWKALTGSEIKARSQSPVKKKKGLEMEEDRSVITVLRLLAALEIQLGSLGPKVNMLLSQAIAMDKQLPGSSVNLIKSNVMLFETLKEKLKGQLFAGIVEKQMVNATRIAIQNVVELLNNKDKVQTTPPPVVPTPEPLVVPGIGVVDKVAIAQQIATALIQQGKTDVTEGELEQLINAVVGMAQASSSQSDVSTPPLTTAPAAATTDKIVTLETSAAKAATPAPSIEPRSAVQSILQKAQAVTSSKLQPSSLSLLQTYNDPPAKKAKKNPDLGELTEDDMKTLLQNFKDLTANEQQYLITYLKDLESKDPERVEKLRKFVNLGDESNRKFESGRLSPFSLREGGANPQGEGSSVPSKASVSKPVIERGPPKERDLPKKIDSSEDDDEEYFTKLSKTVNRKSVVQQMIEEQQRKSKITPPPPKPKAPEVEVVEICQEDTMQEAKNMIANLMGQFSSKYSTITPRPPINPAPEVAPEKNNLLDDYNYQDDIFGSSQYQSAPPPVQPPVQEYNSYSPAGLPPQSHYPPPDPSYNYNNGQHYDNYNNQQWSENNYNQYEQPAHEQHYSVPPPVHQYDDHVNQGYRQDEYHNNQYPRYY